MLNMLKELSDDELQAELDRRKAERDKAAMPQPRVEPDWSAVREMAIDHVESTLRGERKSKEIEHYIYEVVLAAVYGSGIWDSLNKMWA